MWVERGIVLLLSLSLTAAAARRPTQAYPLDLLRTRLAASSGGPVRHGSVASMLAGIVAAEGLGGLYRGLGATLLQVVPSLALNFSIYESARQWATGSDRGSGARPSAATSLACGCFAGFATSTVTFPLDVVRRRMQIVSGGGGGGGLHPASYAGVIRGVLAQTGARGFYAGILPEYCKVLPGVAIAFCTYEQMKAWLHADEPAAGGLPQPQRAAAAGAAPLSSRQQE